MDVGRCRSCGRPFTSGEVTGVGILRARPRELGGPIVEFTCPTCRVVTPLVPHGQGRYAPPGQPPPPTPTEEERRVPWRRGTATAPADVGGERSTTSSSATHAESAAPAARARVEAAASEPPAEALDSMTTDELSLEEALTILGVARGASVETIEQAFHRLALTCHPDKVAHLDPDFAVLAAKKFRRLQAARELLRGEASE